MGNKTSKVEEVDDWVRNPFEARTTEAEAIAYIKDLIANSAFSCYEEKKPQMCYQLANLYDQIRENEKATSIHKMACDDHSHGRSCYTIARHYDHGTGKGLEQNKNEALKYFEKACYANVLPDKEACETMAMIYDRKNEIKQMLKHLDQGCNIEDNRACLNAGVAYVTGYKNTEINHNKGLEYLFKACDRKYGPACKKAAIVLKDVLKDNEKSDIYMQKWQAVLDHEKKSEQFSDFNKYGYANDAKQ